MNDSVLLVSNDFWVGNDATPRHIGLVTAMMMMMRIVVVVVVVVVVVITSLISSSLLVFSLLSANMMASMDVNSSNVKSLYDMTCEYIKKNWFHYKDNEMVASGTPINEMLWDSVRKKINIKMNDEFFFLLLKTFINGSVLNESNNDSKIITISERTSNDLVLQVLSHRKETINTIKIICSKIGLIMWVESKKKNKQFIHIVKIPNHWQWEYSVIDENQIKKNWPIFKEGVSSTSYYDKMWSDLKSKATDQSNFFDIFRNFIEGVEIANEIVQVNDNNLVIKEENSDRRKKLHDLCNLIGLHHNSKNESIKTSSGKMKQVRYLYVYKPVEWLWEYTIPNPYQKSHKKKHKKETRNDERLRRKYCCICHKNGNETELFANVFCRGLYCQECIEEESDGEGNKMSAHKFEPIF